MRALFSPGAAGFGGAVLFDEVPLMITAHIPYTVDTGEKLVNETFGPNNIRRRTEGQSERRPMPVQDGRGLGRGLPRVKKSFSSRSPESSRSRKTGSCWFRIRRKSRTSSTSSN
jgi:hypothetical protein